MKNYQLPGDLRDALMSYLRTQPYGAVAEGMKALEALEELPAIADKEPPKLESV